MSSASGGGSASDAGVLTTTTNASVRAAGPVETELAEEEAAVEIIKEKIAGVKQTLVDKQARVKELRSLLRELGQETN
jgi:phage-related protein